MNRFWIHQGFSDCCPVFMQFNGSYNISALLIFPAVCYFSWVKGIDGLTLEWAAIFQFCLSRLTVAVHFLPTWCEVWLSSSLWPIQCEGNDSGFFQVDGLGPVHTSSGSSTTAVESRNIPESYSCTDLIPGIKMTRDEHRAWARNKT